MRTWARDMTDHTVKAFTEKLESLAASVAQMGGMAEAQLADAIEAIAKRDTALAEGAVGGDRQIDQLQQTIETRRSSFSPFASPCRRPARDAGRDQDRQRARAHRRPRQEHRQARHRAETANPPIRLTQSLARMGRQALAQLKLVLDAYSDRNASGAETVWRQDGEIDETYNSLFRELLTYMMEDPRTIGLSTHLLFVAKNIERTGDHATNIAEVVYHM